MAQLNTSADIKDDALFRAGELTDGTSDFDAQALVYLNRAYRELYMGGQSFAPAINETWWWMKAEANLILDGNIVTGTVNVTNNSNQAVFSATPSPTVDSDVTNWHLKMNDEPDIYKVSSISTATATLDSVFTGTTNTTAGYRLFKIDYDLSSSAIKIIADMAAYQEGKHTISGMSLSEMDEKMPLAQIQSGVPTKYAQLDENTVRFNAYGSPTAGTIIRVDYDFLTLPTELADDSTAPLVPVQYRHILADMCLFYLLGDKDETKQEFVGLQAREGIKGMAAENRARMAQTGKPGQIQYRQRGINDKQLRTQIEGIRII